MDNGRGSILLVENNEDDLTLFRYAFQQAGIKRTLLTVSDGDEAIQYLRGDDEYSDREKFPFPSLLMLDWRLPTVSGYEVLLWLRTSGLLKILPVAVLSGSDYSKDIKDAYELGANSYIVKPSGLDELCVWLARLTRAA
jgi:DNA-binding response OmpR family regulator